MAMPFNNPNFNSDSNGFGLPNETNDNTQFLNQLNSNPGLDQGNQSGVMLNSQHPRSGPGSPTMGGMSHQNVPHIGHHSLLGRGQLGLSQRVTEVRRRYQIAPANSMHAVNNHNFPVQFQEGSTSLPLSEVTVTEVTTTTQILSPFQTLNRLLANAVNDEVESLAASAPHHAFAIRQPNPNHPVHYSYHLQQEQAPPPQHFESMLNLLNRAIDQEPTTTTTTTTTTNDPVVIDQIPDHPLQADQNQVILPPPSRNQEVESQLKRNQNTPGYHVKNSCDDRHRRHQNPSHQKQDGTNSTPGAGHGAKLPNHRPGIDFPLVPPGFPGIGSESKEADGRTHSLPYNKYGPYKCPKCMGEFLTAPLFAAHAAYHYRAESKAEKKRRLEARRKGKNPLMPESSDGVMNKAGRRRGRPRKNEGKSKGGVIEEKVASSDDVDGEEFLFDVEVSAGYLDGIKIKEEMM